MRLAFALVLLSVWPAAAQAPSPYAGLSDRPIRALSAEQQADLRAGRGMSLALAAELNGWPGPLHVLELSERLRLTPAQRRATEELMAAMRAEASALGERIIAEEAALEAAFRDRSVTPEAIGRHTARLGELNGTLRAVHLRTHLAQTALLTPAQVADYGRLRGYGGGSAGQGHHHRRH